ncbi:fimbria/pilus outer membrane usher protein [Providencia rettgeri]|uniref:fimbria/pilus outer membrane usher protein n=1 Tax=Providencia rettgeri TaxID=587 RepID=UPI0001C3484A|nr:fimbria/pilus outer membrane usher protein [Providencia rettgeri]QXA57389.1 fimbrial biogenesis outer membrane usher protein [Providencia rettgeri]
MKKKRYTPKKWPARPRVAASVLAGGFLCSLSSAWAADYFDPSFLGLTGDENVDLSAFAEAGGVAEGDYLVSVYVNQSPVGEESVTFRRNGKGYIAPLLTPELLNELGVNVANIPNLSALPSDDPIDDLGELIPQATTKFTLSKLRLDISVPQIAMKPNVLGQVDPSLWEDGVSALVSNYNLSAGQTKNTPRHGDSSRNTNAYANFRSGLNVGPWRLRSTYSHSYSDYNHGGSQSRSHFDNTYVSRDIRALRSTLLVGESYTGSEIIDGVPFRGVQLKSSDEMLPDRLRGFAPDISGVANSNARVTVRQNGYIVYETYVAPGPFNINDIAQSGQSGDYHVTVTETDGSERQFVVPYSSLPMMLRPGGWNYEITGGRYHGSLTNGSRQENFLLGTGAYGFAHNYTLYGGLLASKDYQSLNAGTGVSLGYAGALSADVTTSNAKFRDGDKRQGQSYRVRYSKSMLSTGTSMDLTAMRYSTRHFYTFGEFNSQGYNLNDGVSAWAMERRRSSFQTQLSQQLGGWGAFHLRGSRDDYWGKSKTLTTLSAGYNNSLYQINYSINYNIDRIKGDNGSWPENRQISANFSVPFSIFRPNSQSMDLISTYATASTTHDNHGKTQNNVGISGSLADNKVSYSVSQGWGNQGEVSNSNANLGYQGDKGNINTGYSYSRNSQSLNVNANGGFVVHSGGVTFARSLGDSVALIHTPGAAGVKVNSGNATTDWNGYAVSPYLSNYKQNNIGIDPTTLPEDVDITQSNVNVYPTKGAVVKVKFATRIGRQVLIDLKLNSGTVPFGAIATLLNFERDELDDGFDDVISSIVGDGGQVYLTGLPEKGTLSVKWGNGTDQQCLADFDLTHLKGQENTGLAQATAQCRSSGSPSVQTPTDNPTPIATPARATAPVVTPVSAEVQAVKTRWLLK